MKIALIGQKGIPTLYGGIERYVENLSLGLSGKGHKVFVYTRPYYTPKNQKKYHGVNLICLPSIHTKHLDAISHVLFASIHALFQDYDIIHYQSVGPALLSWLPRIFKPSAKVIVTFHCLDRKHQKWGFFARLFLGLGEWAACKFPHQTICVSKTLRDYCFEVYGKETQYIPNGASPIAKNSPAPRTQAKSLKEQNLQKGRYLLVVSRLVKHKGIHFLIKAFSNIKTNLKLVIVGDGSFTDDYVKNLKKLAYRDSRIIFTGTQTGKALAALYENCFFYIHPSESEGMSLSILEAMSFGKAVLTSSIPENAEVIAEVGLTFENRNIVDLERQIKYLIANPEEVARLGNLAQLRVKREYNWEDIIKKTIQIYEHSQKILTCQDKIIQVSMPRIVS